MCPFAPVRAWRVRPSFSLADGKACLLTRRPDRTAPSLPDAHVECVHSRPFGRGGGSGPPRSQTERLVCSLVVQTGPRPRYPTLMLNVSIRARSGVEGPVFLLARRRKGMSTHSSSRPDRALATRRSCSTCPFAPARAWRVRSSSSLADGKACLLTRRPDRTAPSLPDAHGRRNNARFAETTSGSAAGSRCPRSRRQSALERRRGYLPAGPHSAG